MRLGKRNDEALGLLRQRSKTTPLDADAYGELWLVASPRRGITNLFIKPLYNMLHDIYLERKVIDGIAMRAAM